ncbi:hypothetical protein [Nostoc sp. NMS4]|uniref:hypothetical protein n=1 Tax=Nostoc sp. NMS4 TaxID=2815390 RepID=UPI0025D76B58|nr:hypothetical protein [Nostoc sp. NMS4]MBN3925806.1 hypothetical protein [Nostoc sp. NMS4]
MVWHPVELKQMLNGAGHTPPLVNVQDIGSRTDFYTVPQVRVEVCHCQNIKWV